MDKMVVEVINEINDAEVMAGWFCDGTENEDWTTVEYLPNGSLLIYDRDYKGFEVSIEDMRNKLEGIIHLSYLGDGLYEVIRKADDMLDK